jgi:predicted nucleic acid-binding protein
VRVCLDSWAVLRWLEGAEPAATRVETALSDRPVMSLINVGEVIYIVRRARDDAVALEILDGLRARVEFDVPSEERVLEAARIKADHPMAFADAFAIATSIAHSAVLLTGDPEIIDAPGGWNRENLRDP